MKLEIFNEQPKQKDVIRLKLVEYYGKIYVDMVDITGETLEGGSLMNFDINDNNKLVAHAVSHVNPSLPVALTAITTIQVV